MTEGCRINWDANAGDGSALYGAGRRSPSPLGLREIVLPLPTLANPVAANPIPRRGSFEAILDRHQPHARAHVYSLISDSYRWHFENPAETSLPMRYREMQLLTDMISGMTDGFAVDLYDRITDHARS